MTVIASIEGKVWLALRARMEQWTETAIHWPDEKFTPAADKAFLIVDPVFLDPDIQSISYDCGEENRGFLNVRVMTPMSWNYSQALGVVGRLAALFPAGLQLNYSDATAVIYRQPRSFGGATLENSWHRSDLRIYWLAWG